MIGIPEVVLLRLEREKRGKRSGIEDRIECLCGVEEKIYLGSRSDSRRLMDSFPNRIL